MSKLRTRKAKAPPKPSLATHWLSLLLNGLSSSFLCYTATRLVWELLLLNDLHFQLMPYVAFVKRLFSRHKIYSDLKASLPTSLNPSLRRLKLVILMNILFYVYSFIKVTSSFGR